MDYKIRKATINDIESINKLFIQMLQAIYNSDSVQGYPQNYLIDNYFHTAKNIIYVAEIDNRVVAFLSIEYHSNEELCFLYLDDCCVIPQWRSQGIGTKLFRCADEYAKKCGVESLFLHVEKTNFAAISLYKKLGYTQYSIEGSRIKMIKTI